MLPIPTGGQIIREITLDVPIKLFTKVPVARLFFCLLQISHFIIFMPYYSSEREYLGRYKFNVKEAATDQLCRLISIRKKMLDGNTIPSMASLVAITAFSAKIHETDMH